MNSNFNALITGVGGQGILWLSRVIAQAACEVYPFVCRTESRGLSQRGGAVCSEVRFGQNPMAPTTITHEEDLVIALDALEAIRTVSCLKKDGFLLTNRSFVIPAHYSSSDENRITLQDRVSAFLESDKNFYNVDLAKITARAGCHNSNVIMAGTASLFLPIPCDDLRNSVLSSANLTDREIVRSAFLAGRHALQPFSVETVRNVEVAA